MARIIYRRALSHCWSSALVEVQPVREAASSPAPEQRQGIPKAYPPVSSNGNDFPSSIDLSPRFPEPGNQGSQYSCVAWALAYALKSYQELGEEKWSLHIANGSA